MLQNQINKNKILNQLHSVTERISLKENQAEQYKRLYEAYVKELSLGEASVMDFKNLMKDISALNHELLQLKTEKQFLINSYNYFNYYLFLMKKLLISMFAFYYLYTFTGCKSHSTEIQETIPKVTVEARPLVKGSIKTKYTSTGQRFFLREIR
jgi:small-conductance mechanosensitive channel